jgi:hypothetical protein
MCANTNIKTKWGIFVKLDVKALTLANGITIGTVSLLVTLFVVLTGRGL